MGKLKLHNNYLSASIGSLLILFLGLISAKNNSVIVILFFLLISSLILFGFVLYKREEAKTKYDKFKNLIKY
jgi:hypothetical protein